MVDLLVMVSFLATIFAAGKTYFFCRMIGDVQDHCCCAREPVDDGNASVESSMDCCQLRTHAAPGDSAPPVNANAPAFADVAVALGAPVAVVPRASARAERAPLPDWTGPPLDQRRAMISVRLL